MALIGSTFSEYSMGGAWEAAEQDERDKIIRLALGRLAPYGITNDSDLSDEHEAVVANYVRYIFERDGSSNIEVPSFVINAFETSRRKLPSAFSMKRGSVPNSGGNQPNPVQPGGSGVTLEQVDDAIDARVQAQDYDIGGSWDFTAGHLTIDGEAVQTGGSAPGEDPLFSAADAVEDNISNDAEVHYVQNNTSYKTLFSNFVTRIVNFIENSDPMKIIFGTIINSLTGDNRVSYSSLKDVPEAPGQASLPANLEALNHEIRQERSDHSGIASLLFRDDDAISVGDFAGGVTLLNDITSNRLTTSVMDPYPGNLPSTAVEADLGGLTALQAEWHYSRGNANNWRQIHRWKFKIDSISSATSAIFAVGDKNDSNTWHGLLYLKPARSSFMSPYNQYYLAGRGQNQPNLGVGFGGSAALVADDIVEIGVEFLVPTLTQDPLTQHLILQVAANVYSSDGVLKRSLRYNDFDTGSNVNTFAFNRFELYGGDANQTFRCPIVGYERITYADSATARDELTHAELAEKIKIDPTPIRKCLGFWSQMYLENLIFTPSVEFNDDVEFHADANFGTGSKIKFDGKEAIILLKDDLKNEANKNVVINADGDGIAFVDQVSGGGGLTEVPVTTARQFNNSNWEARAVVNNQTVDSFADVKFAILYLEFILSSTRIHATVNIPWKRLYNNAGLNVPANGIFYPVIAPRSQTSMIAAKLWMSFASTNEVRFRLANFSTNAIFPLAYGQSLTCYK